MPLPRIRKPAFAILLLLPAAMLGGCSVVPYDERHPDIAVLEHRPSCEHDVLGKVTVNDGHDPVASQSKDWAMRANMDRAMANMRERAAAHGAQAVVISQRRLSRNDDGHYGYIDLRGLAISECR